MKSLYVMRHAKSDWGVPAGADFDRPLSPRGVRAAALVGRFLAGIDEVPDHVLASSAARASETADVALEAGRWGSDVERLPSLYGATSEALLSAARSAPQQAKRVMIVAHEPGISDFVGRLVGDAIFRYPTGALTRVDFGPESGRDVSWGDADFGVGSLRWMVVPRMLEAFARSLGSE